ncbi:restriction endonuclease subunit S [Mariniflexile sp.]|uniref:restriction endonuclease subunit S n=1 Tax=Mariniflexile sp. TaxID=1979402 RepID=UPI0040482B94
MKESKKSTRNVPNLRFSGFEGEWELKKIRNISSKINSGKTPLGGEAVYTSEGVLFIRSQNVNDNRLDIENAVFITEEINNEMKNSIVCPNDILLNITGASLGRSCVVPMDFKVGNVNQHVCIIRLIKNNNPRFLQPYFTSNKGQNTFKSLQTGSGREGLNFESIKNQKVYIPLSSEQTKIANFLSLVDLRIQTQSEIIENLESLIQGLQVRIFNQVLRFKDNNDNSFPKWNKSKLGKFLSVPSKESPEKIDVSKILTVKLHLKGVLLNERTDSLKIGATKYIIRKKGQFIYGKQNLFNGAFGIIPNEFDGFVSSGDVPSLDINIELMNPIFLYHYLGRPTYYKKFEAIASGSGSKRIHETALLLHMINVPFLEEQNRIASFFSKIEDKIQLEKQALKSLSNQKRYFLQQLFI